MTTVEKDLGDWVAYFAEDVEDVEIGNTNYDRQIGKARAALKLFLSQKEVRLRRLSNLVRPLGIELDGSEESLDALNIYFEYNVDYEPGSQIIAEKWAQFIIDVGLYVGEIIIDRFPIYRWGFPDDPDDYFYLETQLMHDIPVKNGEYNLGIYEFLVPYAVDASHGNIEDRKMSRFTFKLIVVWVAIFFVAPRDEYDGVPMLLVNPEEQLGFYEKYLAERN